MARAAFLAALLALLPPPGHLAAQAQGLDRAAIARAVVARMALKPGEKVLFVGRPRVFDTLTAFVRQETRRAGGQDLGVYAPGAGGAGRGRAIPFHGAGAYALEGRPLRLTDRISQVYQRAIVETDYQWLADIQRRVEQAMRGQGGRGTTPPRPHP